MALAVASEIAATLLTYEKTLQFSITIKSTFNIIVSVSVRKNEQLGQLFQDTLLIVWDEYTT